MIFLYTRHEGFVFSDAYIQTLWLVWWQSNIFQKEYLWFYFKSKIRPNIANLFIKGIPYFNSLVNNGMFGIIGSSIVNVKFVCISSIITMYFTILCVH